MIITLEPNERDPNILWSEIHRLRAAMEGPAGFATWKDAAIAERLRANKALEAVLVEKAKSEQVQIENGVLIDRGALQAAINMLTRDAEEGYTVRGELAEELKRAITGEKQ